MRQAMERLAYTVAEALETGAFSSRNKLYAAIARGELRTFRDGKRRMISVVALQEYITRRECESEGQHDPSRRQILGTTGA